MKLTIKTLKFKDMVMRAAKGASENKLLPITSMIAIELKDNLLTLTTTDTANTLVIREEKVDADDFYAVVPVDIFSKLVAKTTSENITLTLHESDLEVAGNGTYKIPLPMDEEGTIVFPQFSFEKSGEPKVINLTSIKNILSINKSALAKNLDTPCICGYFVGDKVITTDENVICFNDINLLGQDVLISPDMMDLLALNSQEKIDCYYNKGYFLFETSDMVLYGAEHDGKKVFPKDEIIKYLDVDFSASCKVPKLLLTNVIDRLSLFIEPYDKNGAYFTFTKEGLKITSKKSSSVELIRFTESNEFQPFICCVDIPQLQSQINAIPDEQIQIWYGNESALKLTSGKVTSVIALLEDEELEKNIGSK